MRGGVGFKWKERFPEVFEAGGFDVVVGNPPYVRQETLGAAFKDYAQAHYQTYAGTADLYVYFMEQGYQLLAPQGRMGYIVPNKWLRANYGQSVREFLKEKIEQLVDFGDLPVFAEATTYPLILTLRKEALIPQQPPPPSPLPQSVGEGEKDEGKKDKGEAVQVVNVGQLPASNQTLESILPPFYAVERTALEKKGWSLANSSAQSLLDKIKACGIPLGEYVEGKIYYGIKTGLNEAFVIDRSQRKALIEQDPKSAELIKPFLAGRDVKRYEQLPIDKFLIYVTWDCVINNYPAILKHLEQFKDKLSARPEVKEGRFSWYSLSRYGSEYVDEFEKTKIVIPAISQDAGCTLDTAFHFTNDKTTIIASDSLYLLGLMNSKLVNWFFYSIAATRAGGYYEYKPMYLVQAPIRRLNLDNPEEKAAHDGLVSLVEKMLGLKQEYAKLESSTDDRRHEVKESIERTDKAIDKAVYALYGLDAAEIAIVEKV